jgi:PTH1 family peptidyl-tRNA hydrolase
MTPLRLIVGIGNPGSEYSATRHNAGAWFVERLARAIGVSLGAQAKFQAEAGNRQAQAGRRHRRP